MKRLCTNETFVTAFLFYIMKNQGKIFEQAIKTSVPDYALLYRLPDPAQSFGGGEKTRFSRHNPFDFLIWNPKNRTLFALEAKTVKGKSISFEREKCDHGEIHHYQIVGLNEWSKYDGVVAGFIIEFREIETTVFIRINDFNKLLDVIDKKSFNYGDLENYEVPFIVVPQTKRRTRYIYNIEKILEGKE